MQAGTGSGPGSLWRRYWLPLGVAALVPLAVLPAAQASAQGLPPGCESSGDSMVTCTYTADSTFTVPAGVTTIHVVADGAAGAPGKIGDLDGGLGGPGAQVTANVSVSPGAMLSVLVDIGGGPGGKTNETWPGGAGGGKSAIVTTDDQDLVVAGGGGGGGGYITRAAGGAAGTGAEPDVALDAGECNPGASGDTARRVIFDDIIRIGGGGGGFGDCPGVGAGGTAGEFEGEAGGAGMDGNGGAGGAVGLDGGGGGGAGLFGGGGGGSSSSGGGGGGGGSSFGPVGSEFSVAGPTPEVVISYTEQPPPEPPVITSTSPLPGGVVGVPYSQTLQAEPADEDDVLAWSTIAGALPGGLTLSTGGVISGTPTTAGMFSFTVTVQNEENAPDSVERGESGPLGDADADADDSATMTFSLTVTSAPPTPSVPQAPVGPVQTGGGTPAGTSPWLPYGGAAAGIGMLLTLGGLARRRYNTGT